MFEMRSAHWVMGGWAVMVVAVGVVACGGGGDAPTAAGGNALSQAPTSPPPTSTAPATPAPTSTGRTSPAPTTPPPASAPPVSWDGKWEGLWIGANMGDHTFTIDYELTINGADVDVSAGGFETDVVMKAKAVPEGNDLAITFVSCSQDDLLPQCTNLSPGDTVFHLHRDGNTSTLVFDKMKAPDETTAIEIDPKKS
jgi:hypothetical protein